MELAIKFELDVNKWRPDVQAQFQPFMDAVQAHASNSSEEARRIFNNMGNELMRENINITPMQLVINDSNSAQQLADENNSNAPDENNLYTPPPSP